MQFRPKSYVFSKFCSHIERFRSETSFLQGLTKKISPLAQHFLCLTLQKTVFRSLSFHIWTQFGERIAIFFRYRLSGTLGHRFFFVCPCTLCFLWCFRNVNKISSPTNEAHYIYTNCTKYESSRHHHGRGVFFIK